MWVVSSGRRVEHRARDWEVWEEKGGMSSGSEEHHVAKEEEEEKGFLSEKNMTSLVGDELLSPPSPPP